MITELQTRINLISMLSNMSEQDTINMFKFSANNPACKDLHARYVIDILNTDTKLLTENDFTSTFITIFAKYMYDMVDEDVTTHDDLILQYHKNKPRIE